MFNKHIKYISIQSILTVYTRRATLPDDVGVDHV